MATFDILLFLLLGVIMLGIASIANYIIGGYRLLSWMKRQRDSFSIRGGTTTSEKEQKAIQETLLACDQLQKTDLKKWKFKLETISLIEKISSIYHPNSPISIEQARLGDILEVLQEANQKILHIIHLPQIKYVTRFRLIQILESLTTSYAEKSKVKKNTSEIKDFLFRPLFRKLQIMVVRSLLVQWLLLVGEASLKVYGDNSIDEEDVEAEEILAGWDCLHHEVEISLSENVQQIAESMKKEIIFSTNSISWKKAGENYFSLVDQIARHYHSESTFPIYEVHFFDLLKSVSDSLEQIGRLTQKPVLNKILKIRIAQLTQAKTIALPLGEYKIFDWMSRYQVGRIAKWSHTLYRTLQKKQPGILFRDMVFSIVKEGGKRWLVLYLHGKIAAEANKLYGRSPYI